MIPPLEPLPDYGDLFTIEEWLGYVKSGCFTDYDGMGSWATETQMPSGGDYVYPSQVDKPGFAPPAWATHVVWFNR
jgi:hypothetical protein